MNCAVCDRPWFIDALCDDCEDRREVVPPYSALGVEPQRMTLWQGGQYCTPGVGRYGGVRKLPRTGDPSQKNRR